MFEQIERVKAEGVDDKLLAKLEETQVRKRETDLKENQFWVYALLNYYRYDLDPRLVLDYQELVDGLSSDKLQAAATRYLNRERYVMGQLVPEGDGE